MDDLRAVRSEAQAKTERSLLTPGVAMGGVYAQGTGASPCYLLTTLTEDSARYQTYGTPSDLI